MNRQKLATIGYIMLSVAFSLSIGLFLFFKIILPLSSDIYAKILYYPEDLYQEYQKEAELMVETRDFSSDYSSEGEFYSENGSPTFIIKVGDSYKDADYSNYITVMIKNYGTNDEIVTYERSRKNAEEAYEKAQNYKNFITVFNVGLLIILVIFTVYLIVCSIKKRYDKVFWPILCIVAIIGITYLMIHYLTT